MEPFKVHLGGVEGRTMTYEVKFSENVIRYGEFTVLRFDNGFNEVWHDGTGDEDLDHVANFIDMQPEFCAVLLAGIQAGYDFARRQQAPAAPERVDGAAEGQR